MRKWFYQRNDDLLKSPVNKTFEQVLWMDDASFRAWIVDLRKEIARIWDDLGSPPRIGKTENEIRQNLSNLRSYQVKDVECKDELTGNNDCIRSTSPVANVVNQWFPSMMKTKINYNIDGSRAVSIYEHFKDPDLLEKMVLYSRRHFKRDSFYMYSNRLREFDQDKTAIGDYLNRYFLKENTAEAWIRSYESKRSLYENQFDYWIEPCFDGDSELEGYAGYRKDVLRNKPILLTKQELESLREIISNKCITNCAGSEELFYIRVFKTGQSIFPLGLRAFRISYCQYAVNFPPLVAKYLYEKYTEHIKTQDRIVVYDPSAGWGGRLLGAMSTENDIRKLHYVGTDPNTEHNTEPGRTKYHELADYYNSVTTTVFSNPPHTYEIFQHGSETIHNNTEFQKYKGSVDLVFTSPPYFSKEIYSNDPEQSALKFKTFDLWVDGFLRPTLETACAWLAKDRYLLWNISDAYFGDVCLPLEEESHKILASLGMEHVKTLKMTLSQMQGGGRFDKVTGLPTFRNYCKIREGKKGTKTHTKSSWFRYEPIFVYKKI